MLCLRHLNECVDYNSQWLMLLLWTSTINIVSVSCAPWQGKKERKTSFPESAWDTRGRDKERARWTVLQAVWRHYISCSIVSLSSIRFWTLLPWWIFYTSADFPLFVPLSRHFPPSSPPHPSPKISLAFLCFVGLSPLLQVFISPMFGAFLLY